MTSEEITYDSLQESKGICPKCKQKTLQRTELYDSIEITDEYDDYMSDWETTVDKAYGNSVSVTFSCGCGFKLVGSY